MWNVFTANLPLIHHSSGLLLFPPLPAGEEEQGSMAEVSYYSYEYDPDSQPFLADSDGHDHFELHAGGKGPEHRVVIPADTQLTTLDTKNTPERWYGPLIT